MTRPRPVLTTAAVAGAVQGIAAVVLFLGYPVQAEHISAMSATLGSVVLGVGSVLFHAVPALYSQGLVTPLADPVVPATSLALPVAGELVHFAGTPAATSAVIADEGYAHADMKGE